MRYKLWPKREPSKSYFQLPNEIFLCETQFAEGLDEDKQMLLNKLVKAQRETASELHLIAACTLGING